MADLLARLCDPTPIAWRPEETRRVRLPHNDVFETPLAALDRRWLLRWTAAAKPTVEILIAKTPSTSASAPWRRLLLLGFPEAPARWTPDAILASAEARRQAGCAPDALARHALLLDLARLRLHQGGHAQGRLSAGFGLEAVAAIGQDGQLHRLNPLPDALPKRLIHDVLSSVLLPAGSEILPSSSLRHSLDAPASAHAVLDLRQAIDAALTDVRGPWRRRFIRTLQAPR